MTRLPDPILSATILPPVDDYTPRDVLLHEGDWQAKLAAYKPGSKRGPKRKAKRKR